MANITRNDNKKPETINILKNYWQSNKTDPQDNIFQTTKKDDSRALNIRNNEKSKGNEHLVRQAYHKK